MVGSIPAGGSRTFQIAGAGGVPSTTRSVKLSIMAVDPTSTGYLSLGASTSVLNWRTGMTIANLASTQLGTGGVVRFYNSAGATHLITDVSGWYVP
mgnify:CR=1 FL=1